MSMFVPGSSQRDRPRPLVPWNIRDTAAAVLGLVLLTVALSLALGSFVRFADDGPTGEAFLFLVAAAGALSGAIALTRFAGASPAQLSLVVLAIALAMAVTVAFSSGEGEDRELFGAPIQLVLTLAVVVLTVVVVFTFSVQKYRVSWSSLGFVAAIGRYRTLGAFGMWIAGLGAIAGLDQLFRLMGVELLTPPDNASQALDSFGGQLLTALVAVAVFVPIAEEMFFRGFVLPALRNRTGAVVAVILSAVPFALFHVDPGLYLPTFILGLSLGAARVWTGSLLPSIMIHMTQNALALGYASEAFKV